MPATKSTRHSNSFASFSLWRAPVWLRNCLMSVSIVEPGRRPPACSCGGARSRAGLRSSACCAARVEDRLACRRAPSTSRKSRAAPSASCFLLTKRTVPMPQFGWQPHLSCPKSRSGPSSRSTDVTERARARRAGTSRAAARSRRSAPRRRARGGQRVALLLARSSVMSSSRPVKLTGWNADDRDLVGVVDRELARWGPPGRCSRR
jgi:hypothetical protein